MLVNVESIITIWLLLYVLSDNNKWSSHLVLRHNGVGKIRHRHSLLSHYLFFSVEC